MSSIVDLSFSDLSALLDKGGPVMVPLFVLSTVLFAMAIEKLLVIRAETRLDDATLERALAKLHRGDESEMHKLAHESFAAPARLALRVFEGWRGQSPEPPESALIAEKQRLGARMAWLAALTSVAPFLGLMGTVHGMIITFETITSSGTGDPQTLSRGISQALLSTQLGLAIAVPGLLAHGFLRSRVRRAEGRLELWATRLKIEERSHA